MAKNEISAELLKKARKELIEDFENNPNYEFENITKFLYEKRILIAGFGREGKSTLNFILKYVKNAIVTIGDEKDFNFGDEFAGVQVSKLTGKDFLGNPDDFDIMIK